jgi:membrane associated rhomboid family serine protease
VLPILGSIAYAAHLGGFIAGALLATRLGPRRA